VSCCALEDGERARELVAQHIAFYIGGMGTFYRDNLARQGYDEFAHDIHDAWQRGERDYATDRVRAELRDQMGAAGTPDEARTQLQRFESIDGVDAIYISFPRGSRTGRDTRDHDRDGAVVYRSRSSGAVDCVFPLSVGVPSRSALIASNRSLSYQNSYVNAGIYIFQYCSMHPWHTQPRLFPRRFLRDRRRDGTHPPEPRGVRRAGSETDSR